MAMISEDEKRNAWSWAGMLDGVRNFFNGSDAPSGGARGPGSASLPEPVQRARASAQGSHSRTRASLAADKLAMWKNAHRPLVFAALRANFHPENFLRMQLLVSSWTNVLSRVVSEVSILYENPAQRRLVSAVTTQTEGVTGALDGHGPSGGEDTSGAGDDADGQLPGTGDAELDALADALDVAGSATQGEETPFDRMQKAADWDMTLDTVEKLCSFLPVVWVRPVVRYEKTRPEKSLHEDGSVTEAQVGDAASGSLSFIIYTPDQADVVPDPEDPSKALVFWYRTEAVVNGKSVRLIRFWTPEEVLTFDEQWKAVGKPEANPYGRLPVTAFRISHPVNDYYCDGTGDDLFDGTIELCVLRTIQNARARDAGFKQLAIQGGSDKNTPADQVMGGPSPIFLGEGETAVVLDMQPQLDQFTQLCERRSAELAAKYGISSAEWRAEGNPQSGFAKKLDMVKVVKESKRRRKFFAAAEKDLYHLVAVTLDARPISSIGRLDPTATLETDFAEPHFEEDPQTEARVDAIDLKLNAISVLDVLRRKNPDLTDMELLRLAAKNRRINAAFMPQGEMQLIDVLADGPFGRSAGAQVEAGAEVGAEAGAAKPGPSGPGAGAAVP